MTWKVVTYTLIAANLQKRNGKRLVINGYISQINTL